MIAEAAGLGAAIRIGGAAGSGGPGTGDKSSGDDENGEELFHDSDPLQRWFYRRRRGWVLNGRLRGVTAGGRNWAGQWQDQSRRLRFWRTRLWASQAGWGVAWTGESLTKAGIGAAVADEGSGVGKSVDGGKEEVGREGCETRQQSGREWEVCWQQRCAGAGERNNGGRQATSGAPKTASSVSVAIARTISTFSVRRFGIRRAIAWARRKSSG